MIHCEFNWSENRFDSFSVWDIVEHETDGQFHELIELNVEDVFNKIDELKHLCISVLKITDILRTAFNEKFPHLAARLNFTN